MILLEVAQAADDVVGAADHAGKHEARTLDGDYTA